MAIKMPSAEQMRQAQDNLELSGQIDRYRQMIEAGRGTPVLWYNLGVSYLQLGEYGDAKLAFEKAIEMNPEMMEAYVNLGAAYFQTGNFEESVQYLEKALGFQPDFLPARVNLGITLMKMGRHEESSIEMEKVLVSEPGHPAALGALALCSEALGRAENAKRYRELAESKGVQFRKEPPGK